MAKNLNVMKGRTRQPGSLGNSIPKKTPSGSTGNAGSGGGAGGNKLSGAEGSGNPSK